jgi:MT-A70
MSSDYELLDIPFSLSPSSFRGLRPLSSIPPSLPRNPPEPKNGVEWPQAKDLEKLHSIYGLQVERALQNALDNGVKGWCQLRSERLAEDESEDIRQWHEMFRIMDSFKSPDDQICLELSDTGLNSSHGDSEGNELRLEEIHGRIIKNPYDQMRKLTILLNPPQTFYIPAQSSFLLDTFPSASRTLTNYTLEISGFDLIVLDPPWSNKAVSRLKTKKDLAYTTMRNIFTELPPVGSWLSPGGIVAIWCTNNVKTIERLKNVLFRQWRVELVAEWVWLKV